MIRLPEIDKEPAPEYDNGRPALRNLLMPLDDITGGVITDMQYRGGPAVGRTLEPPPTLMAPRAGFETVTPDNRATNSNLPPVGTPGTLAPSATYPAWWPWAAGAVLLYLLAR